MQPTPAKSDDEGPPEWIYPTVEEHFPLRKAPYKSMAEVFANMRDFEQNGTLKKPEPQRGLLKPLFRLGRNGVQQPRRQNQPAILDETQVWPAIDYEEGPPTQPTTPPKSFASASPQILPQKQPATILGDSRGDVSKAI
jgi:hypothetical protein